MCFTNGFLSGADKDWATACRAETTQREDVPALNGCVVSPRSRRASQRVQHQSWQAFSAGRSSSPVFCMVQTGAARPSQTLCAGALRKGLGTPSAGILRTSRQVINVARRDSGRTKRPRPSTSFIIIFAMIVSGTLRFVQEARRRHHSAARCQERYRPPVRCAQARARARGDSPVGRMVVGDIITASGDILHHGRDTVVPASSDVSSGETFQGSSTALRLNATGDLSIVSWDTVVVSRGGSEVPRR